MIGVVADPMSHDVVRETFELLKTPWEIARNGRRYDVVLSAGGRGAEAVTAKLVIVYSAATTPVDEAAEARVGRPRRGRSLSYGTARLPLYGDSVGFGSGEGVGLAMSEPPHEAAGYVHRADGRMVVRLGYDLFAEIRALLTSGQPPANAGVPTLELHLSVLREAITGAGVPLVEIPPVPEGHDLVACLTHDVDHPAIRHHRWDHTALGFLYRATVGSVLDACRGRARGRDVVTNWGAALRWPLVHLGLANDFWADLGRYRQIDGDRRSTFFVIPFKGRPGRTLTGQAPAMRAAGYGVRDIADEVRRLKSSGCEVGVHGIDAWVDGVKGRDELKEVWNIVGGGEIGVRMHWLYTAEGTAATLERSGFAYDSTSGYNETVGYRAGTTQVFKPLDATRLLELPLHVMDTALFSPRYLNLAPRAARARVRELTDQTVRLGGVLTVNWHDRSLAPERLWGDVYRDVVTDLRSRGAWLATASQAVAWFRRRRTIEFDSTDAVRATVPVDHGDELPGFRLRVHKPRAARRGALVDGGRPGEYVDRPLSRTELGEPVPTSVNR